MRTTLMTLVMGTALLSLPYPAAGHDEFDAVLHVPFRADEGGRRQIVMAFFAPEGATHRLRWRLTLLPRHDETPVRSWRGERMLGDSKAEERMLWRENVPAGVYRLRLHARLDDGAEIEQSWPLAVGPAPRPRSAAPPARRAPVAIAPDGGRPRVQATPRPQSTSATAPAGQARLAGPTGTVGAAEAAGYAVYLGNLHSQTNHSDGGGALDRCDGAQAPQSGEFGPSDAYAYADRHGLDFLMTSEHNHMYDGSDRTAPAADADAARALFHDGLRQAAQWNAAQHQLLALYGQEWGVISNGGHLDVLNADALLGWEHNAQGELLADEHTPRNDYASLYQLMRSRGWFGQFNHPRRDQFAIGDTPLAWNADGDASMLLCEVMNSSAYSINTSETEPHRSNFESSCNALLEAGYHLAFSSNQDNHCANWGAAYSNRTAVLLPRDTPLSQSSLLQALQARRVFASMDKHAQLLFTANGHMMGKRIVNRGKLTLRLDYSSGNGRALAAVAIFHGVPGRNGKVTALTSNAQRTITPLPGEHFYYARATQDDGKMLWSAPIWVTQRAR